MKFDVSRVYTAINADELPVGSKCIFADTLKELEDKVLKNDDSSTYALKKIGDEDAKDRFGDFSNIWNLAYLVERPEERIVKPFETIEEAREAIFTHGGFIKDMDTGYIFFIAGYSGGKDEPEVFYAGQWYSLEHISKFLVFADDGSPCGVVEE